MEKETTRARYAEELRAFTDWLPSQGEGGLNPLPQGFLKQLRELCDQQQWLLMLDEVQTGNGRTGQYFAYQHEGILPDVVTTAKGLTSGYGRNFTADTATTT